MTESGINIESHSRMKTWLILDGYSKVRKVFAKLDPKSEEYKTFHINDDSDHTINDIELHIIDELFIVLLIISAFNSLVLLLEIFISPESRKFHLYEFKGGKRWQKIRNFIFSHKWNNDQDKSNNLRWRKIMANKMASDVDNY